MLPRLQAEERLAAIDVALLASGGYEAHGAQEMIDGLHRKAQGEERPAKKRASPAQLVALGIGVTIVPPAAAPGAENVHG